LRRFVERNRTAVQLSEIAHDCQPQSRSRRCFVGAHAALEHRFAHRWFDTGTVVVDRDDDARVVERRRDDHARPGPLTRVVEQIAEHFLDILSLPAHAVIGRHADIDRESALGVQAQQRARERARGVRDRAARAHGGP
jgi:hypothetical protein